MVQSTKKPVREHRIRHYDDEPYQKRQEVHPWWCDECGEDNKTEQPKTNKSYFYAQCEYCNYTQVISIH